MNKLDFELLAEWCADKGYVFINTGDKYTGFRMLHGKVCFPFMQYPTLSECMYSALGGHTAIDDLQGDNTFSVDVEPYNEILNGPLQ